MIPARSFTASLKQAFFMPFTYILFSEKLNKSVKQQIIKIPIS